MCVSLTILRHNTDNSTPTAALLLNRGFYKSPKMPSYSEKERVALAVVYCLHVLAAMQWQAAYVAARADKELASVLPEGDMTDTLKRAARRVGKKFMEVGTVANLPRAKKVKTRSLLSAITPDEAKLASYLLKTGYVERTPIGHGRYREEHFYYESLGVAMEKCPHLKSIYDKYAAMCDKVDHQTFMEALYKYDPLLRVRRIHMKYALSEELKAQRQRRANSLLTRAGREPNFLQRLFFVDECGINFDHEIRKGVHVYCDAHDKGFRFVIPVRKLSPNKGIKVKVMGAVNMLTGPIFMEFTTGTTGIERIHNKPGGDPHHHYQVSVLHSYLLLNPDHNAPRLRHHLGARQHADQHFYICQLAACLVEVHSAVPHTQHNT